MKRSFLVLFLVPAMLLVAGAASATHWGTLTRSADCDGWCFEGSIIFGAGVTSVVVEWEVVLTQDGMTVCTTSGQTTVFSSNPVFSKCEDWCDDLCGSYNASGTFFINATPFPTAYLDIDFRCMCDEEPCNLTQGYWKNHPDAWPVTSLMIGGTVYSKMALLDMLNTPPKGDATIILVHQLIAAMLNVANGSDDSYIGAHIIHANALLTTYPIGSNPRTMARAELIEVAGLLDMWNNLHCDDFDDGYMPTKGFTAEDATWGSIKGLYGK